MIGALTVCGLTTMMTIEGGTDAAVFLAFVTEVLGPRLTPGDMVILDNAGAHKDARIKDAVEARGAKLVFLPPYSPDLNPIEECWSKVKSLLRSAAARTKDELNQALSTILDLVTPSDACVSALVWTSFDPLGQPEVGNRPTDLTAGLAYGAEFGPFTAEPSATVVTFPGLPEGATTVELGLEAALSLGPIAACTTQSLDAVAFRGAYCAKAGACAAHDFGAGVALEGDVGAGGGNRAFNEANFGVAAWGLDHVEANVAITIPADSLYLRAHGTVSRLVHPDLVRALPEPLVGFAGLAVGAEI
jgi:transposase